MLEQLGEVGDGVVSKLDLHRKVCHSLVVAGGHLAVVTPTYVELPLFLLGGDLRSASGERGGGGVGVGK